MHTWKRLLQAIAECLATGQYGETLHACGRIANDNLIVVFLEMGPLNLEDVKV